MLLFWEVRVRIVKGVVYGLVFMYGFEIFIVYRDIKVSNVLLDNEFEVYIVDFGLVWMIEGVYFYVFM